VRTIAILNQKGGCGKTTTAISLAGHLASRGRSTLLVDLDPQSHCAAGLAVPEARIDLDVGDALLWPDERLLPTDRLLWRIRRNLDLMPSRVGVAGLESSRGGLNKRPQPERRLARLLTRLADDYHVCILDCSPSIGLITYNALAAATDVLIPVDTGFFSLQGAARQVSTVRSMGRRLGRLIPYWLVATIHDDHSPLSQDLLGELRRRFTDRLAPVVIHRDTSLKEAASFGLPVGEYAPESPAAQEYAALADWILDRRGRDDPPSESPGPSPQTTNRAQNPEQDTERTDPAPTAPPAADPHRPTTGVSVARSHPVTIRVTHSPPPGLGRRLAATTTDPTDAKTPHAPPGDHKTPRTRPDAQPAHATALAEPDALLERRVEQLRVARSIRLPTPTQPRTTALMVLEPPQPTELHETLADTPAPDVETPADASPVAPHPEADPALPSHPQPDSTPPAAPLAPGPHVTGDQVRFVAPAYLGHTLAVAGDFNDWSPDAHPMRLNHEARTFELSISLAPGRYEYRLVVDGHWTADPFNPHHCLNPFGEPNSLVTVQGGTP